MKIICMWLCVSTCVCVCPCRSLFVCVSLRHGRCFWFSGQSGGDHCKAGVSEGGVASMHGFGAVWRQDAAILPHTSCDGQTGLVPHGFRKRQLMRGEMEGRTEKKVEMAEWRFCLKRNHLIDPETATNAPNRVKTQTSLYKHMHQKTLRHACACTHTVHTSTLTISEVWGCNHTYSWNNTVKVWLFPVYFLLL